MTDEEVLAAIRISHLKANISGYERNPDAVIAWAEAWLDPGGVLWGPGPYAKVPIYFPKDGPEWSIAVRAYPPERLRKRLAKNWKRGA